ncbi:MAG: hypothetical protein A2741_01780 [Candidatus Zambryskibacteria bacterium RIFCSPHIGHO2_01_FULL_43_27]|uniref:Peptidoglycan binding-like domain-containing protein n=2 Tax=Patescibacteria group TaxID=1783273 RepID=A0A1G2U019_9BACT|nr:MAG: hypothetical protein A3F61_01090 [Candidatus Blackburnbacteria bacterium RIFCSPHIGHO2_12_FULL_41_13b]OHA89366.1 MAG: hypothetical protein A2741_01780 [Candidatus Zambryskibacteria bacterium RIFCSPHIGHO2_01_FULL_43_27]OHB02877.1 MAG: hypothetical protein A2920_00340 [Candidatus Zambryskibacteria bacterium RIFCSPLOWO2_01_FULL_43_17]
MTNNLSFSRVLPRIVLSAGLIVAMVLIMGIPTSASAALLYRQLEEGMTGSDVSDLQTFLARDNTIYPQGLVTGFFGSLTKSAVSNFQARNGISTVGRVGPITLAAINAQMGGSGSTTGFDRQAPIIYTVSIGTSSSGATVNWNTSENASAIVYYSTNPIAMSEATANSSVTIYGTSLLVHSDLRTSHSASITGLQGNTTYYYVVYVKDANGNETITWPSTFRTS